MSAQDLKNVEAFSQGHRVYSSCVFSLYLWFSHDLVKEEPIEKHQKLRLVLTARLFEKRSVEYVCQHYGFTGKKMLNQAIKDYVVHRLINH